MTDKHKYWAIIWALVALVIITIISTIARVDISRHDTLAQMVKAGANPIEAMCSLNADGGGNSRDVCLAYLKNQ